MDIESFWDLAARAAALLPPAPTSGSNLDWMSWRELVWETARRLGTIGRDVLTDLDIAGSDDCDTVVVDAMQLIRLAASLHRESLGAFPLRRSF